VTDFAQHERKALCDLLDKTGPDAPTLCEGWTTADLAAHLILRERRPVAGLGIVFGPLADHTEKVQRKLRDGSAYDKLVDTVRHGPPLVFRLFDEPMNTAEYFIHVEDVRRASPAVGAPLHERLLPEGLENALWSRVKFGAKGLAKKVSGKVVLVAAGHPQIEVGSGPAATITGAPGEILLFLSGRGAVAQVQFDGDPSVVAALKDAKLGI
jgi:uncharacterized protein (TIGR03085 family)